jgi:hypothetical protein
MAGVYVDGHGALHLFIPEMLEANGYSDTPENRDMMVKMAQELAAKMGSEYREDE